MLSIFQKYTLGEDYHIVVKRYLEKICGYIESLGGKAIGFVDNNPLPERYILLIFCGIGFVGIIIHLLLKIMVLYFLG